LKINSLRDFDRFVSQNYLALFSGRSPLVNMHPKLVPYLLSFKYANEVTDAWHFEQKHDQSLPIFF